MLFKKAFRLAGVGDVERLGRAAGIAQRNAQGFGIGGRFSLRGYRLAARAKRLVRLKMVVPAPAGHIGPCDRQVLATADLQRRGQSRIWNRSSGWRMRAWSARGIRCN